MKERYEAAKAAVLKARENHNIIYDIGVLGVGFLLGALLV